MSRISMRHMPNGTQARGSRGLRGWPIIDGHPNGIFSRTCSFHTDRRTPESRRPSVRHPPTAARAAPVTAALSHARTRARARSPVPESVPVHARLPNLLRLRLVLLLMFVFVRCHPTGRTTLPGKQRGREPSTTSDHSDRRAPLGLCELHFSLSSPHLPRH